MSGARQERTSDEKEFAVVNPFLNTFHAADGDNDIARSGGLEDEADGYAGLSAAGIHVGGEVVGKDGTDDLIVQRTEVNGLVMVREVCGVDGVGRIYQSSIEDRLVKVPGCIS